VEVMDPSPKKRSARRYIERGNTQGYLFTRLGETPFCDLVRKTDDRLAPLEAVLPGFYTARSGHGRSAATASVVVTRRRELRAWPQPHNGLARAAAADATGTREREREREKEKKLRWEPQRGSSLSGLIYVRLA